MGRAWQTAGGLARSFLPPNPAAAAYSGRMWRYGGVLVAALLLAGCEKAEQAHYERREQQLRHDNALYVRGLCVEAIERRRSQPGADIEQLPRALDGQSCQSPALGDYALGEDSGKLVRSSVIRLDPTRLSAYTLDVVSLDGERLTYQDRGVAAAAAEQAGTYGEAGSVPAGPDASEGDPNRPEVSEDEGAAAR